MGFAMTRKRRQLENMIAETNDTVVRMQLTNLLNEELQRQNGLVRRISGALDSLLRETVGRLGKRSDKDPNRGRVQVPSVVEKPVPPSSGEPKNKGARKQTDDLSDIIAAWPTLPEHVKAAISDILHVS
jgi:DNA replication initiation complex subunit (GINS family)